MNSKNIVKKDLLRRKINEYFSNNPKAKSVIITADVGEAKTFWKVKKEGKTFNIVEVNTKKDEFIFEQTPLGQSGIGVKPAPTEHSSDPWDPNNPEGNFARLKKSVGFHKALLGMPEDKIKKFFGVSRKSLIGRPTAKKGMPTTTITPTKVLGQLSPLGEASSEFTNMSREFTSAMAPPFDHGRLSRALKSVNTNIARLKDPNERNQASAMLGALTNIVDTTTSQAGGMGKVTIASKQTKGDKLREQEEDKPEKKKSGDKERPEPTDVEKPANADVGLETDVAPSDEKGEERPTQKSQEELMVSKGLGGQTVRDANIELTKEGGALHLDLVAIKAPVRIEWTNAGKVTFVYKDRPYVLRMA